MKGDLNDDYRFRRLEVDVSGDLPGSEQPRGAPARLPSSPPGPVRPPPPAGGYPQDDIPDGANEPLRDQIERLGQWIMDNVPGEPSRSESAVATAIRLLAAYYTPETAHLIEVARTGHVTTILVDGAPIPSCWFANGSPTVVVDGTDVPRLSLDLLAERVTVDNSIGFTVEWPNASLRPPITVSDMLEAEAGGVEG